MLFNVTRCRRFPPAIVGSPGYPCSDPRNWPCQRRLAYGSVSSTGKPGQGGAALAWGTLSGSAYRLLRPAIHIHVIKVRGHWARCSAGEGEQADLDGEARGIGRRQRPRCALYPVHVVHAVERRVDAVLVVDAQPVGHGGGSGRAAVRRGPRVGEVVPALALVRALLRRIALDGNVAGWGRLHVA